MLIGLAGKAGSGKDTLGGALVEDFGFERVAFADPLKEALLETNPWIKWYDQFKRLQDIVLPRGWDAVKDNPEIRKFLQDFGVAMRNQDKNVWLRIGRARITELQCEGADVVVTDVRFRNEAQEIHRLGGFVVRVDRGLESTDEHPSEIDLDRWVYDIIARNHTGRRPSSLAHQVLLEIYEIGR